MRHRSWRRRKVFALVALAGLLTATPSTRAGGISGIARSVGLTPEICLLAGVESESASQILTAIANENELLASIHAAHTLCETLESDVLEAQSQLMQGVAPEAAIQVLQTRIAEINEKQQELASLRQELLSRAIGGLTTSVQARIVGRISAARFNVPAHFLVLDRNEEEWKEIESALASERRALSRGQAVPESVIQELAQIRSNPSVLWAQSELSAHLDEMIIAFDLN